MSRARKHNMEEVVVQNKLNLDSFNSSYITDHNRVVDILGMNRDHIIKLFNTGFIFDFNKFIFKSTYDFKVSDTLTKIFDVTLGKSSEGYYLCINNEETGIGNRFDTFKDFNNYINPLNLLFQLKSFIETDKKFKLYFLLKEDINNCVKNKNGYIEIEASDIRADGYTTYPYGINHNEVLYQIYVKDKKQLEANRRGYSFYHDNGYYNDKHYTIDDKDLITTSEGYYVSWRGKKFLSNLSETELENFSKVLTEPLEFAKSKKTFKKFVKEDKEENKETNE